MFFENFFCFVFLWRFFLKKKKKKKKNSQRQETV